MENSVSILLDESKWPYLNNPDLISKLELVAITSFHKNTEDAYIASILIFQQIIEEMIRVLIMDSEFVLATQLVSRFSYKIHPTKARMFGEYIEELKQGVEFCEKNEIIEKAQIVNKKRIEIAHKIVNIQSIEELYIMATDAKEDYHKIKKLFNSAHKEFIESLKDERSELESAIDSDLRGIYYKEINKYNNAINHKILEEMYEKWLEEKGKKIRKKIIAEWLKE
ncbi:hypothetical protein TRIP_E70019 [uncultured Spirochaetota bacterium]|jgi:hypothetical protein|nr:hypothetical protein TRIP_E70019 [uncultured Spirochaetota bacterium]